MEKYSNFIQRFRYLIIILTVLLTVVMLKGTGILFSNIDNDYRSFFTKDNPELLAFDSIQNNFSKSDNALLVIFLPMLTKQLYSKK